VAHNPNVTIVRVGDCKVQGRAIVVTASVFVCASLQQQLHIPDFVVVGGVV
jgi:hypothetical protein